MATTKPEKIVIGNSIREFVELGVKAEEEALELYRKIITESVKLGDRETRLLFNQIYREEEEHLLKFQDYLEIEDEPDLGETPESEWRSIFTSDYIRLLNKALASEISAIIQYTNQHEKASSEKMRRKKAPLEVIQGKNKASVVSDMLKEVFLQEMKHLEMIAERIFEVDREALAEIDPPPEIGESVEDFIRLDREAENYAIVLYRKIIGEATKLVDIKTKEIFESIIQEEEEHYWMFDDFMP
jgi:bacterioferritin